MRLRNVTVTHLEGKSAAVDFSRKAWVSPERFQFRTEQKAPASPAVIQRLDPHPVHHQMQDSLLPVPECEGKHPHKLLHGLLQPPLADGRQHDLRVGMAAEAVALRLKFMPKLCEVVDLAVKDYHVPPAG